MCRLGINPREYPGWKEDGLFERIVLELGGTACGSAVVQQPNWLLSFVGYDGNGNGNGNETHLHVESARALGDGIEGRVGLEGGGGADDQAGDGELHGGSWMVG